MKFHYSIIFDHFLFMLTAHLHVWWKLKKVDTHVDVHLFLAVDVQLLVGVDGHEQRADVCLKR